MTLSLLVWWEGPKSAAPRSHYFTHDEPTEDIIGRAEEPKPNPKLGEQKGPKLEISMDS